MDKDLSFNEHISKICKKINNQFNVMIRFRNLIPRNITTKLYKTFILPHFYYCSCLWHFGYSRDLDKLNKLNKRILRCICNDKDSSYHQLLDKVGCVSL